MEQQVLIKHYALVHLGLEPGRVLIVDAPHAAISRADMRRWLCSLIRAGRHVELQIVVRSVQ